MKTELVFKLENKPEGYTQAFAPNCQIDIKQTEGTLFLNYENRPERAVGHYKNLRKEGEVIVADVEIFEKLKSVEERFEYAIEGSILKKNDNNEATSVAIIRPAVIMNNKF